MPFRTPLLHPVPGDVLREQGAHGHTDYRVERVEGGEVWFAIVHVEHGRQTEYAGRSSLLSWRHYRSGCAVVERGEG